MNRFFSKMQAMIREKLQRHERGLYVVLLFPIAFACLLTFAVARLMSHFWPWLWITWGDGLHVHHFAYGFFVLAAAGYLALIFSGPRAKFLIALLFGFGLGLAFDEFAMWIKLRDEDVVRMEYDGMVLIVSMFFLLITLQPGVRFILHHWPFSRQKLISEQIKREPFSWDTKEN